jgi:large subunit ribosomal protein L29
MKVNEIRNLSTAELDEKVAGLKEELFNLRFQLATGQLENPMRIREVKKTIARIKTVHRFPVHVHHRERSSEYLLQRGQRDQRQRWHRNDSAVPH